MTRITCAVLLCMATTVFARQHEYEITTSPDEYTIDGVPIDAETLAEFFAEKHGKRRAAHEFNIKTTLNDQSADSQVVIEWIISTDEKTKETICTQAQVHAEAQCLHQLNYVFHGVIIRSTLPQLVEIVGTNPTKIKGKIYPSLSVKALAIQTSSPWGLDRIDGTLDDNFNHDPNAGQGVKVYVIDTGVRCTHNDFGDRCTPGWSAYQSDGMTRSVTICDPTDFTCAADGHSHGTHCAGTVGGTVHGVAKSVSIVAVKVLANDGWGFKSDTILALDWVMGEQVANPGTKMIASLSLGGGAFQPEDDAIASARASGVICSVAAGNDDEDACNSSPARAPAAITVGSTTSADAKSYFSNFGTCLDIWAPGSSILSAGHTSDTATTFKSGTSMACPHVTGVLAQIWSSYPTYTATQVESALIASASVGEISGIPATPKSPDFFLISPTCISKNDDPSPLEVNSAMQAFCPLYATGVGVKGKPKYGGSAEMCKQKDQKYETRLHQAMFHGMFGGASSSGRDCGAWCLFDVEEPNRHFRWDNKKGCWKTRKNRPCKDSTNEERGFAADIFDSFCAAGSVPPPP